ILATAADGDVTLHEAPDPANGMLAQPTAWLFGNEAHGLGDWLDLADIRVSIPMRGQAESLNLATAASVCIYESSKAQIAKLQPEIVVFTCCEEPTLSEAPVSPEAAVEISEESMGAAAEAAEKAFTSATN